MAGSSSFGKRKARIEIVPLIDIMFFLLACFMLVSLSMVASRSVPVDLPTARSGTAESVPETLSVSVDATGGIFLDRRPVGRNELQTSLSAAHAANPEVRVVITGDNAARHGAIIAVLDRIRLAGIQSVAFQTRESSAGEGGDE